MDYKEKLRLAKEALDSGSYDKETIEYIFPELKESEDEKVKKSLTRLVKSFYDVNFPTPEGLERKDILTWLEKQGEQKPYGLREECKDCQCNYAGECKGSCTMKRNEQKSVKVPKFKVGDWVIDKQGVVHQIAEVIENVTNHTYGYDVVGSGYFNDSTEGVRLWTIQDAKEGDVLHSTGFHNDCIFIFNRLDNWKFDEPNGDRAVATGYCCLSISADKMEFGIQGPDCVEVNTIKPATKIQHDLLFQKMKEAGYQWDAEKKELKKIEHKSDEWEPQTGDTFRKKGTTSPTYYLCNKREDGITFGFVENREVGIAGGEITIFSLKSDYELVERLKSIEDESINKQFTLGQASVFDKHIDKFLEKNIIWSEEDEEMHRKCICAMRASACGFPEEEKFVEQVDNWHKSLRDRVQPQPKQEWSEEDKVIRNALIKLLETLYSYGSGIYDLDKKQFLDWLQKLEGRIVSK